MLKLIFGILLLSWVSIRAEDPYVVLEAMNQESKGLNSSEATLVATKIVKSMGSPTQELLAEIYGELFIIRKYVVQREQREQQKINREAFEKSK